MRAILQGIGTGLLVLLMALSVFLGATREGRATVKSALFIPQVFNVGIKPLEWFTPEPIVERVTFPIPGGTGEGDIYRPPGEGPYSAVLLFLGVAPAGRNDSRVINLGNALARSNMVSLWYWSPAMMEKRMEPGEIDNLVAAFDYLASQEYVDQQRIGMGGFCVGASFTLMAASQEAVRDRVAFVNAFGPYFDMRDLLKAITSKSQFYADETGPWDPDHLTREVYVLHLTQDLPSEERSIMRKVFLDGQPLDRPLKELSREGQAVHQLLKGVPLEEAEGYLQRIPPKTQEDMALMSPRTHLEGLKTRVLIMHDREDDLVPAYESRRLADALKERGNVRHTEFGIFRHVTPNLGSGLDTAAELLKFFRHMHAILLQAT